MFPGAVLHATNKSSVIWQPSVSVGPYSKDRQALPPWELEFGVTWDSGIFVNQAGQSHKEIFLTMAGRYRAVRVETWNDTINNKYRGPTYGATLTINLLDESFDNLRNRLF